jgi:hypothetical protein
MNAMTTNITGLFDSYADAQTAVTRLEEAGVARDNISIVANTDVSHAHAAAGDDAGAGAAIGAGVGGVGGLLTGLGIMAIPGVGPVVAAGWLVATVAGAVAGAAVGGAAGGLVGALTNEGVPEEDAHVYAEGVRRGGTLVSARVDEKDILLTRAILQQDRSVDVSSRRRDYEAAGWQKFDPDAPLVPSDRGRDDIGRPTI